MSTNETIKYWIDHVIYQLTRVEENRLEVWITDLMTKNEKAGGSSGGFLLGGKPICFSDTTKEDKAKLKAPVLSLSDEIMDYQKAHKILVADKVLLKQSLTSLLHKCQYTEDVRNALPEYLAIEVMGRNDAGERTKEEAYTIKGNPIAKYEYQKLCEKVELYMADRMLG